MIPTRRLSFPWSPTCLAKLEGGKHIFLDPGEEAIKRMSLPKGMKVNLFASEKDWPELTNPVQMAWDTKGRLWVAVWHSYPHWKPKDKMDDKLLIFEDTKGTGKADKMTVFADNLHCPTGFEFWNGGVILAQVPDIVFLKDTTGRDKADTRVTLLERHGFGRHASYLEQLRHGSRRRHLLAGRDVPSYPGGNALGPAGSQHQCRRLSL